MKTNLENYEERFVDYVEGLLDPSEMREVEAFVAQHPELEEDFKLFCISKLEPDRKVTYEHKEKLLQSASSKPKVIQLFVRVASAAAVIAVLFGVGGRFLRQGQKPIGTEQELIATLPAIQATEITMSQSRQELAESTYEGLVRNGWQQRTKNSNQQGTNKGNSQKSGNNGVQQEPGKNGVWAEAMESIEITDLEPIRLKKLPWDGRIEYCCVESDMIMEAEMRLAQLESFNEEEPVEQHSLVAKSKDAVSDLGAYFFGNAQRITRSIYKQTAKSVLSAYYTADCYLNEAREKKGLNEE